MEKNILDPKGLKYGLIFFLCMFELGMDLNISNSGQVKACKTLNYCLFIYINENLQISHFLFKHKLKTIAFNIFYCYVFRYKALEFTLNILLLGYL